MPLSYFVCAARACAHAAETCCVRRTCVLPSATAQLSWTGEWNFIPEGARRLLSKHVYNDANFEVRLCGREWVCGGCIGQHAGVWRLQECGGCAGQPAGVHPAPPLT
eukprot:362025-Chlamydomonas_euryale.AAC.1